MNARLVVVSLVVMLANGCTCAGCEKQAAEAPAAPVLGAKGDAAPIDAGRRELPYEVTVNAPPDETLAARYAADCHHVHRVRYDDIDAEVEKPECEAIATEQNDAPDTFGCWAAQEKCVSGCAAPCNACEAACATSCDTCKRGGQRAEDCGRARLACRNECLSAQMECRSACLSEGERCGDLGDERIKTQCPDCDAINQCLWDRQKESPGQRQKCLLPGNARECLEWCFAE